MTKFEAFTGQKIVRSIMNPVHIPLAAAIPDGDFKSEIDRRLVSPLQTQLFIRLTNSLRVQIIHTDFEPLNLSPLEVNLLDDHLHAISMEADKQHRNQLSANLWMPLTSWDRQMFASLVGQLDNLFISQLDSQLTQRSEEDA